MVLRGVSARILSHRSGWDVPSRSQLTRQAGHGRQADFLIIGTPRETQFSVPKIAFIVTSSFATSLENHTVLPTACSKNTRIRAEQGRTRNFQKSAIGNGHRAHRDMRA